jgi:hypothetical protein
MTIQQIDLDMRPSVHDSSKRSSTASKSKEDATELDPVADEYPADEYPHGARLAVIVLSLMLGMFLVALDNVSHRISSTHCPELTKACARLFSARLFLESQTNSMI